MFLYELVTFTIFFLLLVSTEHSDSCVGDNACTDGLHVGKGSCNGIDTCLHFGDRLSNSINYHMIKILDNSCNGDQIDQLVVIIFVLIVAPLEVMYFVAPSEVV